MDLLLFAIGLIGGGVCLVFLVIKAMKKQPKKKKVIAFTVCVMLFLVGAMIPSASICASKETSTSTETPTATEEPAQGNKIIYADGEIVDLMNGYGTAKVGTISVTKASQADCTEEALADWYFNFVEKNTDCNYHLIIYTNVADKGVYANKGFVQKDVSLTKESNGNYMLEDDAGSTYYTVNEDERTITVRYVMADEQVVNNAKVKIDKVIPETYKNGKLYAVDVAGEARKLDCNLTLINADFGTVDCQNVAVEIASKIKELDLGIGYFCIAFQSDDYTLNALSSLDNLATQDASEITTYTF